MFKTKENMKEYHEIGDVGGHDAVVETLLADANSQGMATSEDKGGKGLHLSMHSVIRGTLHTSEPRWLQTRLPD